MKHALKPSIIYADGQTTVNLPFILPTQDAMRKNTTWTANETAAAKALLGLGLTADEIAKRLFRSEGAVSSQFCQLGLQYTTDPSTGHRTYIARPDPSFGLVLSAEDAPKCEVPTAIDPTRPTPHHHAKLIIAWARGHQLQVKRDSDRQWEDWATPTFAPDCSYRIKPGPMPTPEELADAILDVSAGRQIGGDLKYRLEMARVDVVSWSVGVLQAKQAAMKIQEATDGAAAL